MAVVISDQELTNRIGQLNTGNVSVNKTNLLADIKSNYESIFAWEIYETTGRNKMTETNFLRKINQKIDLSQNNNNEFNLEL